MSKKKVLLNLFLASLLIVTVVTLAVAQVRTPGVSVGDLARYADINVNWSSNDSSATSPEWMEGFNETEWMFFLITGVSGTNITVQATEHFKNDTERIRPGWIDIDTGNSSNETNQTIDMEFSIISANLEVNDTIYSSAEYSTWKINETIVKTYPDETRNTNHLNLTWEFSGTINGEIYYYNSMNYYWDKSTGIMVEMTMEWINQTGPYLTTWSAEFSITDSNIWVIPEFPSFLLLPLFIISTLLAVIFYRRKHVTKSRS